MLVWGLAVNKVQPKDWLILPPDLSKVPWSLFVNTIIWANGGYDDVGNIAEELKEPKKVFPRATFILIGLSILSYVGSVVAVLSLDKDYSHWVDGTFSDVAEALGGKGLLIFMSIAAMVSSLGQFNSLLCVAAQELRAMGKPHLLGIQLLTRRHSRLKTPMIAIAVCIVCISALSLLPFVNLVQIDNVLYSFIMLLEYSSLIKLRYKEPNLPRPYRISKSNLLTILFVSVPMTVCVYIIVSTLVFSFMDFSDMASITQGILAIAIVGGTAGLYKLLEFSRRNCSVNKPKTSVKTPA
jgi:amino acid transporter